MRKRYGLYFTQKYLDYTIKKNHIKLYGNDHFSISHENSYFEFQIYEESIQTSLNLQIVIDNDVIQSMIGFKWISARIDVGGNSEAAESHFFYCEIQCRLRETLNYLFFYNENNWMFIFSRKFLNYECMQNLLRFWENTSIKHIRGVYKVHQVFPLIRFVHEI